MQLPPVIDTHPVIAMYPIIDTPEVSINYDATNDWLYVDWRGAHTQESSRAACLLMLDALRAQPRHKILNDNSNITHTSVELNSWSMWWLEEMLKAGLQYIAWVMPRNFAARQATEATVRAIEKPIVSTFDDVATAYLWLQRQG